MTSAALAAAKAPGGAIALWSASIRPRSRQLQLTFTIKDSYGNAGTVVTDTDGGLISAN